MIAQISVSWNEKYEHDGFLFFAQRIVEMLDYMTVDIYRAPLLNTSRLIDEYLRIALKKVSCANSSASSSSWQRANRYLYTSSKYKVYMSLKLGVFNYAHLLSAIRVGK